MKDRNVLLSKGALITVLLLVSTLIAQGQSDESRSGQWRIAGQNLSNSRSHSWSHKISDYDGVNGAISRVSPAIDGNQIIIGDIPNSKQVHNGANVISVDRQTGTLRWMTQVDTHPAAIITGSP